VARNVSFRDFDWLLLFLVLLICAVGVVQIYSATLNSKFVDFHIKQIYWVVGGMALMFGMSRINYQALLERVPIMYAASIMALVAVLIPGIGKKALGARRWFAFGGGHFQPSEWVKLILILAMAKYFADSRSEEGELRDIIKAGLMIAVPMLLVLAEPDMGTALTYTSIAIMGLFLGGLKFKHTAVVLLVAALCAPVAYKYGLKDYQRNRLLTFVNPEADPDHKGYQVIQSKIAVGSGGITGKGVAKGTQTQGSFLPIAQTDFIAAAFAEEHGLIGALILLLLYFMVLMRLVHNAQTAPDRAGTFIVMGVVAVITFHVLINVGMVVGFMPVTGIPLPLMSYGGSSVLFTFLALGIVMNVRMRRFVN
jgi:rod shape determining protein RodA